MAIYIWMLCCKCHKNIKLHLYSCSKNKNDIFVKLCDHFNVKYTYICKWGFFTLGWKIILEVKVQCRKCNHNYYNFGQITFNSDYYNLERLYNCCYNVFSLSVDGYKYLNDGKGTLLQAKLKENEEKIKKEQELNKQLEIQNKENQNLDKLFKYDSNFIDEEFNKFLSEETFKLNWNLTLDIEEKIDEQLNFQIVKIGS